DNKSLGKFHLDGIPPAPRGIPQIEVTFDIDANGILNVSAKDKASGKEQSIRIESSGGLNDDEIARMKREAQENSAADKKRKEEVELRNQADQTIHSSKKQLEDLGDKIPADDKAKIEEALAKLEEAVKSGDIDAIRTAREAHDKTWSEVSQRMYQSAGSEGATTSESTSGSGTENVEEADYTIVDEDEKK
ncbi:MAG: Hsp70 family protein, partial [Candidatus Kapaibacterium sp.]